jgi:hypothetical protein
MLQFRTQTDQMTSQFQTLSLQLALSTPRPLTPSNLHLPPGTTPDIVDTVYDSDASDSVKHAPDNPITWLKGPPMVASASSATAPTTYHLPIVGTCTIRYSPVAATITPHVTVKDSSPSPSSSQPPAAQPPSWALFSGNGSNHSRSYGSQSPHQGNGSTYGPHCTHEYISGYYWESGMPVCSQVCVPWLELSLQGSYNGKSEKLQKAPLSLADDTLTGFIQFYNVLRANLHSSGYNIHLLPDLPSVRPNTDLALSPVLGFDLPTIGTDSFEHCPDASYWQHFHDSFDMILYAILSNAVKTSATRVYPIVKNTLHMGVSNGFKVMHEIFQQHHPKVKNSLALAYDAIIARAPKMQSPKSPDTYKQMQANYIAGFCKWETTISLYPEASQSKPSQRMLAALQGVLPALRPYVLILENSVICHQNTHCFTLPEPILPRSYDLTELFSVLKAAVQSHDAIRNAQSS